MKQDTKVKSIAACAVDVGYFCVKYTLGRKSDGRTSEIQCATFPALAPAVSANQALHAQISGSGEASLVSVKEVDYMIGKGASAFMKASEPRPVDPDYCTTEKYYALTLGALDRIAEHAGAGQETVIESLVLGLPLNTYLQYHQFVRERAMGEHLIGKTGGPVRRRITVKNVHVMVQPHGAMVNFGARRKLEGTTLVVDPGGGTLDWFLVNEEHQILWPRCGAFHQAMIHVARAIADDIKDGLQTSIGAMNAIDKALRTRSLSFMIGANEYEMERFQPLVDAVLEQSIKAMMDKAGPLDDVRRVLFTGGGALLFRSYMENNNNYKGWVNAFQMDDEPVFSNVRGFQIAAEELARSVISV